MACRLVGAMLFSEPVLEYWNNVELNPNFAELNAFKNAIAKWWQFFFSDPICSILYRKFPFFASYPDRRRSIRLQDMNYGVPVLVRIIKHTISRNNADYRGKINQFEYQWYCRGFRRSDITVEDHRVKGTGRITCGVRITTSRVSHVYYLHM